MSSQPQSSPAPDHAADQDPDRESINPQSRRALAAFLLVLAMLVMAGLGFYIGRATAPTSTADSKAPAQSNDASGPATGSDDDADPAKDYASSQESEAALTLLRSVPRRDADDPRALGAVDAPVVMSEFADFSCPMCTRHATNVAPALQDLIDDGILRIEFNDLPIFPQYGSDIAAAGGLAAAEQGKFWEFYEVAYSSAGEGEHPSYTEESVIDLARQAGVPDIEAFTAALISPETAAEVSRQQDVASTTYWISSTPFFMINDAVISGAYPESFLRATIMNQAELVK